MIELADIPADASVDVTDALNEWIAQHPPGAVLELPDGARYLTNRSIRITKNHTTLHGNGAELVRHVHNADLHPQVAVAHVLVRPTVGVRIYDLNVTGPKDPAVGYQKATEGQHGFLLAGAQDVLVRDCSVAHVHGDIVNIRSTTAVPATKRTPAIPPLWCWDVWVDGVTGTDAGRHGLCIDACDGLWARHLNITNVDHHPYHREPTLKTDGWRNIDVDDTNYLGRLTYGQKPWILDPEHQPRHWVKNPDGTRAQVLDPWPERYPIEQTGAAA